MQNKPKSSVVTKSIVDKSIKLAGIFGVTGSLLIIACIVLAFINYLHKYPEELYPVLILYLYSFLIPAVISGLAGSFLVRTSPKWAVWLLILSGLYNLGFIIIFANYFSFETIGFSFVNTIILVLSGILVELNRPVTKKGERISD